MKEDITVDKNFKQTRVGVFSITFSLLVTILVVLLAFTFGVRKAFIEERTAVPNNLSAATWKLKSTTSSSDTGFTLVLESSIGNIRRYNGVRSYGISNDGQTLAISTESNFSFINLPTDETLEVAFPFSYDGDFGNSITWSFDDESVAFIASKTSEGGISALIIVDKEGIILNQISDSFTYATVNSKRRYYPAIFSPIGNLVLTRIFEDENKSPEQDPVSLKLYNLAGTVRKEIPVREAVSKTDQISYTWSRDGERVLYSSDSIGTRINYSQEYQFNQEFIGF